ncbi:MAG: AAA family ATPase [Acidobacteriia bacterium]|nr:AAA family ATPase [Terriglobia bacterium]
MSTDTAVVLPNDPSIERAILGKVLVNPAAFGDARDILRPTDFHHPRHKLIWSACLAVAATGGPPDLLSVRADLERRGKLEAAGGLAYLSDLDAAAPPGGGLEWWTNRLRGLSWRRILMGLGEELTKKAGSGVPDEEILRYVEDLQGRLRDLDAGASKLAAEDLADVLGRDIPPTPWAVPGLLAEGDKVIESGAGGIGKSWLLESMALSLASGWPVFAHYDVTRQYKVALLDLESRPWETDGRLSRLAAGMGLKADAARGFVQVIRSRIRFDDPRNLRLLMSSLKSWGTEFLFVDSFRRMTGGNTNDGEVVANLFNRALDPISMELGCGVVIVDHTRKRTGEAELDAPEQALHGSVDKRNASDAHFGVEARQERLAFIPTKTRHGRLPDAILLEIHGLSADVDSSEPVIVRCVGSIDRASDKVQDAIVALLTDVGEAGMLRGEIIGRAQYSTRAVTDGLSALTKRGKTHKAKEDKQTRYFLADASRGQRGQTSARRIWEPE